MKLIPVSQAAGQILCHDHTRIIRGTSKEARFRKGHVITPEDIPVLLSMGKESVYIWESEPGMLHENQAAGRLRDLCLSDHMSESPVKEGKIELFSTVHGVFYFDNDKLTRVNLLDDMVIALRNNYSPVKPGDKIAGMRVVPLTIREEALRKAGEITGDEPLLRIAPYKKKKAAVVVTGSEILRGRIEDSFSPVVEEKLTAMGAEILGKENSGDDKENITRIILDFIRRGAGMVFCTGGMSVDPDDRTPAGIRGTGAEIISYGAPVLPGSMFLLSYLNDIPVIGLPGCVMYARRTIFDLILPRLMADLPVSKRDLAVMGNGGLCLDCQDCTFPDCGFGKGAV